MRKKKIKINNIIKKKKTCPVCGKYLFSEKYEICPICGWEDDPIQRSDPDFIGGANKMSLNMARKVFNEKNI